MTGMRLAALARAPQQKKDKPGRVVLIRCNDYSEAGTAVEKALRPLGGMKHFVKKGDRVLLKINQLTDKSPGSAVTTHPMVVRAAIESVRKAGGIPSVGDSPAIWSLEKVARASGILEICRELDTPLIALDRPERRGSLFVSARLKGFDAIINLPKLKTHALTGLSGAVKNMYGVVPGKAKAAYHLRFPEPVSFSHMLIDINLEVLPKLTIMDAIVGMEGQGPVAGEPRKLGFILAGESSFAVDDAALKILGMRPWEVPTVALARKRGHSSKLEGDSAPKVRGFRRARNRMPGLLQRIARRLVVPKPVLLPELCDSCKLCLRICPAHAISFKGERFDYSKCIRCYCCQEICPRKAIALRAPWQILG